MTTEWSHLPNAVYIDRVLASLNAHPKEWEKVYEVSWGPRYRTVGIAKNMIYGSPDAAAWGHADDSMRLAACNAGYDDAFYPASDAVILLFAYDDSAHLLDSSPEEIKLLIALGHPYAFLMLPAVTALSNINALTNA